MTVRLVDVARTAGVSLATASRALTGRAGVSPAVADRIRGIARELGYVANPHARTLAGGATSTVGLIVHQIDDPYFAEIAAGVLGRAGERDLLVQINHSGRDPATELRQVRHLVAQRVDVIVIAGSGYHDPAHQAAVRAELSGYQAAGGRVTVIGRHALGVDAVLPENRAGARTVTGHLLALGHRRIAVAAGTRRLTTVTDRLAGAAEALAGAGLRLDADVPVVTAEFTTAGGREAAARIRRDHPGITAVVALSDAMAIGVLATLRAHRVRVPEDISVVGFDDVAVAADLAPALTTVRLPMAEMGRQALALALAPRSARPRRRMAGHRLVVRDSTGPAPAGRPGGRR